jgi:2'-5' RNA ligase
MPSNCHRLFFAVLPGPAAATAIEGVVTGLRESATLRGRWTASAKHHITVRFLGDHVEAAPLITRAHAAAARVEQAPFDVTLDRIACFRGRFQAPCVLRCSHGSEAALETLWSKLGAALAGVGVLPPEERRFIPHLTVGYVDRVLEQPLAIAPVSFAVSEFVLVDSTVGPGTHEIVGRWTLAGQAPQAIRA